MFSFVEDALCFASFNVYRVVLYKFYMSTLQHFARLLFHPNWGFCLPPCKGRTLLLARLLFKKILFLLFFAECVARKIFVERCAQSDGVTIVQKILFLVLFVRIHSIEEILIFKGMVARHVMEYPTKDGGERDMVGIAGQAYPLSAKNCPSRTACRMKYHIIG